MKTSAYTLRQAAKYLSISEPVLRLTVRCGKIPARRGRGGQILIEPEALAPFLNPLLEGERKLPDGEGSGELRAAS